MQGNTLEDNTANTHAGNREEMINFEEDLVFCIPPLFNSMLHEERLQEDEHPYVIWATLKLSIPTNPINPSKCSL